MSRDTRDSTAIEVEGLRKVYGSGPGAVEALRGIDVTLSRGEFVGLVGPSGSGKTTLLNLLGCLDRPTSGTIRIWGEDLFTRSNREMGRYRSESVGFIFQSFNLFPTLTAHENVEYPLLLRGVPSAERGRRVAGILERVALAHKAVRRPDELSSGEKQRVAIARALVHTPKIVLADEPTANLDSETGSKVVDLLSGLNRESGTTFIISTHDAAIIGRLGRVLGIRDGRLIDS